MSKKIMLLGGSGALGSYLIPELLKKDYKVHVVSRGQTPTSVIGGNPNLTFEKANVKDDEWLKERLKDNWDVIVDFMIYATKEFEPRAKLLMDSCTQYVFLSSYRVYSDAHGIVTEDSPRLLERVAIDDEFANDRDYLLTDDYALAKARQEDIIHATGCKNVTILRPAPTFSTLKYQLVSMEANSFINRALEHKITVLPGPALKKQATMNWSGDVAKMIAGLILNDKAFGETYTVATAEHHTWGEIADYYKEIIGMDYVTTDIDSFLDIFDGHTDWGRRRLMYDRMYDRVIDNSKILRDTNLTQSDFMSLKDSLKYELSRIPADPSWCHYSVATIIYDDVNRRMDEFVTTGKYTL